MIYYQFSPDVNQFDRLKASSRFDKALSAIKRQPLGSAWQSVPVQVEVDTGVMGDFPGLASHSKIPVFSEQAWKSLESVIGPFVEGLPLRCKAGIFFAINVLAIEDCLDEKKTVFARLASN